MVIVPRLVETLGPVEGDDKSSLPWQGLSSVTCGSWWTFATIKSTTPEGGGACRNLRRGLNAEGRPPPYGRTGAP